METLFADTYALYEMSRGNPEYAKYTGPETEFITTRLNLMELYYAIHLRLGEETAESFYELFLPRAVDFANATIKRAMKFRLTNREKKFSYIDALGYQVALESKVKFLTGDRGFKGTPNVEFVKGTG